MLIKTLYIKGFGKFNQEEFHFEKGLNLIYGLNEAGKSTLHQFIEGMFFGFYNPTTKTKKYTSNYDRYLPWNTREGYEGVMVIEQEGRTYRIERNFLKRHDSVRVFEEETGREITDQLGYNPVVRLPDVGSWLGLSEMAFKNTISIGQLKVKTEKELATELKDHLANLSYTKDQDISIEQVLKVLDKQLDEVGTERRKQTPLGIATQKIDALQKELKEVEEVFELVRKKRTDLEALQEKDCQLIKTIQVKEQEIAYIKWQEIFERRERGKELIKELQTIEHRLEQFKQFEMIDEEMVDKGLRLKEQKKMYMKQLEVIKEEIAKNKQLLTNTEEEIEKFGLSIDSERLLDELERVPYEYEKYQGAKQEEQHLLDQIKRLSQEIETLEALDMEAILRDSEKYTAILEEQKSLSESEKDLERDAEEIEEALRRKKSGLYNFGSLIIFGLSCFCLFSFRFSGHYIVGIMGVLLALALLGKGYLSNKQEKVNKNGLIIIQQEIEQVKNKYRIVQSELQNLLDRYQLSEGWQFKGLEERVLRDQIRLDRIKKECYEKEDQLKICRERQQKINNWLKAQVASLKIDAEVITTATIDQVLFIIRKGRQLLKDHHYISGQLESLSFKEKELLKVIDDLEEESQWLLTLGLSLSDPLEEVKQRVKERDQLRNDRELKRRLIQEVLKGERIESLDEQLRDLSVEKVSVTDSKERVEQALKELQEKRMAVNKEMNYIENSIKEHLASVRTYGEIELELTEEMQKKERLLKTQKALHLAKETLIKIANDIHQNFAPRLNAFLSEYLSKITSNQYSNIKVTETMDLLVEEPLHSKYVSVDQLSHGTIDQMYLALRMGAIDLMKGDKNYPLILDDAFIQYDDERLIRVLEWLTKGTYEQILLFTCQEREAKLLQSMGVPFKYSIL